MTKIINSVDQNFENDFNNLLTMNRSSDSDVTKTVAAIIDDIRKNGDEALLKYTHQFDKNSLDINNILLEEDEIERQSRDVPSDLCDALKVSMDRVRTYHEKQLPNDLVYEDNLNSKLGYVWRPVESVGIYVPGGTASYPSTVIMNAIPAVVAGVEDITMVTPMTNTAISPSVLYAAKICGIKKIYCIGGAQAVAALAYGTKTIKSVNKIVGPGNIYVAEAKRQVSGFIGIDMFAGPSEVVIIADEKNDPKIVAADLIAQAEHDQSAQSILLTTDQKLGDAVNKEVENQIDSLPRKDIAASSWENNGKIIITQNLEEAVLLSNKLAPEHLELLVDNPEDILKRIKNAGAVFMGRNTPEALGDYLAGPSHVLPTSRSAKFSSGLSVFDFLKKISLVEFSKEGIEQVGDSAIKIADNEGLDGHSRSIEYRLTKK